MGLSDRQMMVNTLTEADGLRKYSMLQIPPDLHDQVLEGLDTRQMTLEKAAEFVRKEGYQITGESIRRYYKAVLAQRRKESVSACWLQAADVVRQVGSDKMVDLFMSYMMSQMMAAVETGQMEFPVKEFLKFMSDFSEQLAKFNIPSLSAAGNGKIIRDVTPEKTRRAIEDIYGPGIS